MDERAAVKSPAAPLELELGIVSWPAGPEGPEGLERRFLLTCFDFGDGSAIKGKVSMTDAKPMPDSSATSNSDLGVALMRFLT